MKNPQSLRAAYHATMHAFDRGEPQHVAEAARKLMQEARQLAVEAEQEATRLHQDGDHGLVDDWRQSPG